MQTKQQGRVMNHAAVRPVGSYRTEETGEAAPLASSKTRLLFPALLSAGLLWLCYFPVAWGWLGWIALVPLLCLVRSPARPRTVYLSAWAGSLLFFIPVLQW